MSEGGKEEGSEGEGRGKVRERGRARKENKRVFSERSLVLGSEQHGSGAEEARRLRWRGEALPARDCNHQEDLWREALQGT